MSARDTKTPSPQLPRGQDVGNSHVGLLLGLARPAVYKSSVDVTYAFVLAAAALSRFTLVWSKLIAIAAKIAVNTTGGVYITVPLVHISTILLYF